VPGLLAGAAWKWRGCTSLEGYIARLAGGRRFVFVTHHKTGTNLMQGLCNTSAMVLTFGRDQCAFCPRVRARRASAPERTGWLMDCTHQNHYVPAHGPLQFSVARFTLVSSMSGQEAKFLLESVPDARIVHMVRDPASILLSAHRYHKFLASPEGKAWRFDLLDDHSFLDATSAEEELRVLAGSVKNLMSEIVTTHLALHKDPRVLTLDLKDFERDFDGSTAQLYSHFYGADACAVADLVNASRHHDVNWEKARVHHLVVNKVAKSEDKAASSDIREALLRLGRAGDPALKHVFEAQKMLGYPAPWEK